MIPFLQNFSASLFWFLVVVGVLVFLHESGHFLTAKFFGMRVEVFSFGFGKRLFGRRRGETDYRVSLIPLGGYVKLAGGEESTEQSGPLPDDYYLSRPRWQRFLVLVMGATVNIVLAVALFSACFMAGVEVPREGKPVLRVIDPGSPAAKAGFQPGDRIVRMNDTDVATWAEVRDELLKNGSKPIAWQLDRDGSEIEATFAPTFDSSGVPEIGARGGAPAVVSNLAPDMPAARAGLQEDDQIEAIDGQVVHDWSEVAGIIHKSTGKQLVLGVRRGDRSFDVPVTPVADKLPDGSEVGRIGFTFKMPVDLVKLGPLPALRRGVATALDLAGSLFHVLRNLVTLHQPFSTLSGPIEIAKVSRATAAQGVNFFMWMGFISLQLGILNLLPIPVLDGGHTFILLAEGALRRDLSATLKERLNQAGFIFLLVLMAAVVFQDILKNI